MQKSHKSIDYLTKFFYDTQISPKSYKKPCSNAISNLDFMLRLVQTYTLSPLSMPGLLTYIFITRRKCPPGTCSGNASHVNFSNVTCLMMEVAAVAVKIFYCCGSRLAGVILP